MKKLVSIFIMAVSLLALAPSFVQSQTGVTQIFERGINIPNSNYVTGFVSTKQNNFLTVSKQIGVDYQKKIIYFNAEGNSIWQNDFNLPKECVINPQCAVDMNGENGFLVLISYAGANLTQHDTLIHFDYNGNIVKKIKVTHPGLSGLSLFKGDNHYYIAEVDNRLSQADISIYDNDLNFLGSFPVLVGTTGIIGRDGYLYISNTGYGGGIISNRSSDLSKYDLFGNLIWTKHFPDRSESLVTFGGDDLYMANVKLSSDHPFMTWEVIKFDTAGNSAWTKEWKGDYPSGPQTPPDLTLGINDLVDLPTGGCVIVGEATKLNQADPINPNMLNPMAIAFNSDGDIAWKIRIDKEGVYLGCFSKAIWDNNHYLIMVGENMDTSKLIWKYSVDGVTAVEKNCSSLPSEFRLGQNYPNPFNPTTTINFSIVDPGLVSLKVYNLLGQEVAILVDEELSPGNYNAKFDAGNLSSGIYVYVLKTSNYTASKKMILLK